MLSLQMLQLKCLTKIKKQKKEWFTVQELVKIDVGQSIEWVPTAKGHNVEMLAGPDGYDLTKKTKLNETVTITFTNLEFTYTNAHLMPLWV